MKKKYLIVVEKTKTGYSAYSPDVPGCVATARTKNNVEKKMEQAIEFHLKGLRTEGIRTPQATSYSTYLAISA